jgi:predicted nucleic acid-binding protein
MRLYVDASAWGKLLVEEPESAVLEEHLQTVLDQDGIVLSAVIAEAEVRRIGLRRGVGQAEVTRLFEVVEMIEVDRATCRSAGLLQPASLRSLDALHVAAALAGGADQFVTYDRRQASASEAVGIPVTAPGADPPAGPADQPGPG